MLSYMLDTNICIYVMTKRSLDLLEKFNALAEQLCISSVTLGELHYGAEKSARREANLTALEHFVARLDVLAFDARQQSTMDSCAPNCSAPAHPAALTTFRSAATPGARG